MLLKKNIRLLLKIKYNYKFLRKKLKLSREQFLARDKDQLIYFFSR